jgi:hypothetical protein
MSNERRVTVFQALVIAKLTYASPEQAYGGVSRVQRIEDGLM